MIYSSPFLEGFSEMCGHVESSLVARTRLNFSEAIFVSFSDITSDHSALASTFVVLPRLAFEKFLVRRGKNPVVVLGREFERQ